MVRKAREFNRLLTTIKQGARYKRFPMDICLALLGTNSKHKIEPSVAEFFHGLSVPEKYYWIGNLYTNLIPRDSRKQLAAFFTPPYLSEYVISRVRLFGANYASGRLLDPASGGAAFLTPIALEIIGMLKKRRKTDREIGQHLLSHLKGLEIEKNLCTLSDVMLRNVIARELPGWRGKVSGVVNNADALTFSMPASNYDLVISNPPYGRLRNPSPEILAVFADAITDNYVNKYVLFFHLALHCAKPGGFIAFVAPMSFIAGPYLGRLRDKILREASVLAIDLIEKRTDIFFDVEQDACVVVLQKKGRGGKRISPACRLIMECGGYRELGAIDIPPVPSDRPWVLPSDRSPILSAKGYFSNKFSRLENYGYGVRAGYFVWNREKERYAERITPNKGEYPLIWAHGIKPNHPCELSTHRVFGKKKPYISFVRCNGPKTPLVRQRAIIMQRTINNKQKRRIVAGHVTQKQIRTYRALVTENHTIVVSPLPDRKQALGIKKMCRLLNSRPVDLRFRQISVTLNVSAKLLMMLPLPPVQLVRQRIARAPTNANFDEVVESCYRDASRGTGHGKI